MVAVFRKYEHLSDKDVGCLTRYQAEEYCMSPIFDGLNTSLLITRVNQCMKSKSQDAIIGAMTTMEMMGFNFENANKLKPTRVEAQKIAINLIRSLQHKLSYSEFTLIMPKLQDNGFLFLQREDITEMGWCWAEQCGGTLRFRVDSLPSPLPQTLKEKADD